MDLDVKSAMGEVSFENENKFTYDDVLAASIEYFNGDELAATVFASKYALCDSDKNYYELAPANMHRRLAKEFARIEAKYPNSLSENEIFDLLDRFKYVVPQGSPMSAIGNHFQIQSLGNCFTIKNPLDSYGGILKADQELVQLMKRRAGVGICLDNIRPKGTQTKNAAKTTDGVGIFMERFSNSCREVAIHGRRGAEMQMLSVHHPDIETFINIKRNKTKVTGANVSVKLTDEFMNAVKNDDEYEQRWPIDSKNPKIIKKVKAKQIWDQLINANWESAEPGLFFEDAQHKYTPSDIYDKIQPGEWKTQVTNPCGEIGMNFDSCRLLLVNLFPFVKNAFETYAMFDFDKFNSVVIKAQRLMDDIVDLELECIEKIINKIKQDPEPDNVKAIEINLWKGLKEKCINGRRTGLGVTGLGDALAALGVRYGSNISITITEKIYKTLAIGAYHSSCQMAQERGAFPIFNYELETKHPFLERVWNAAPHVYELYKKYGRRNIALTTTAPAGSVSTLTQTTSGIEPVYLLKYDRFRKVNPGDQNITVDRVDDLGDSWERYTIYHHGFKKWMDVTGKTDVESSPYFKATSNDVDWVASVKLQAVAQKWICHSISKTCNVPKNATKELVSEIYMKAWEEGCKGFTVYRDGCRDGVLVETSVNKKEEAPKLHMRNAPIRPEMLKSETHKIKIDFGDGTPRNTYVTISFFPDTKRPYEIFVQAPYQGLEEKDLQILELTARNASMNLRHGVPIKYICEQLDKVGGQYIFSIPTNIARVLRKYSDFDQPIDVQSERVNGQYEKCPQCKNRAYIMTEGCGTCMNCGHSGCS